MTTGSDARAKRAGYLFFAAAGAFAVSAAIALATHAPLWRCLFQASPAVLFAIAGIQYLRKR